MRSDENSLDAVSDRDFAIEFISDCALAMMHLSRMSEELVLWVSAPFAFVEARRRLVHRFLDHARRRRIRTSRSWCAARVHGSSGHLNAMLVLMEGSAAGVQPGQPGGQGAAVRYRSIRSRDCLRVFAGMLGTLECRRERMREGGAPRLHDRDRSCRLPGTQGGPVPRRSRGGRARGCEARWRRDGTMSRVTLDELRTFSPTMEDDVFEVLTPRRLGRRTRPIVAALPLRRCAPRSRERRRSSRRCDAVRERRLRSNCRTADRLARAPWPHSSAVAARPRRPIVCGCRRSCFSRPGQ